MNFEEKIVPELSRMQNKKPKARYKTKILLGFSLAMTSLLAGLLLFLFVEISVHAFSVLSFDFIFSHPSKYPEKSGILSALAGSVWIFIGVALLAIPAGVGSAIYIEEYNLSPKFKKFLMQSMESLAGTPSIIFGMLGFLLFVNHINIGRTLLTASLTLSLIVVPFITVTVSDALQSVPKQYRMAGYATGLTRWQVIRYIVLPIALPDIFAASLFALTLSAGESAPLLFIGAFYYAAFVPSSFMQPFTTLPVQIFTWTSMPEEEFALLASGAIFVFIVLLFSLNFFSLYIKSRYRKSFQHTRRRNS